jgi:hypothetical protein
MSVLVGEHLEMNRIAGRIIMCMLLIAALALIWTLLAPALG